MRKIFVSALAFGAAAAAGATVSVEARAESAPITLGAAELDAIKGGQALIEQRNVVRRSGNARARVRDISGDDNRVSATSTFTNTQRNIIEVGNIDLFL
jgi:cobalamin biosynthesis protein CbiD